VSAAVATAPRGHAAPLAAPHAASDERAGVGRAELYAVFGTVAAAATLVAAWLSFVVQDVLGDALSRTYAALVAVHAAEPHLAAIGFIWPPLPTILQIPLLMSPHLAFYGFSGGVVCALFAGLTAVVLDLLLARAGLGRTFRFVGIALFFLNPLIAFYSANGMSELPFLYCFVQAIYCYLRWTDTRHWNWLITAAFASALMVLTRYDALFFSAAFAGVIVLTVVGAFRALSWPRIEASVIAYLTPVAFVTLLWVYFNWQIKGDPLYFLRSEYSNAYLVRDQLLLPEIQQVRASVVAFALYLLRLTWFLSPLLLAASVPLAISAVRRRDLVPLGLAVLLAVVPLFQAYTYRQGQTFGFLRFYISLIPAGLIAGCEVVRRAPPGRWRALAAAMLLLGLVAGNLSTLYATERVYRQRALCDPAVSPEQEFNHAILHPTRTVDACRDAREMGTFIATHVRTRSVIADVSGNPVVLFSEHPELFVLLSDRDYETQARTVPASLHFVLDSRTNSPEFRALDGYFAGLNSDTPPGLTLVHASGAYRLYAIDEHPNG
jgi:hypothetical protein